MRRSRGPGARPASPSARPGTSPRPATGPDAHVSSALAGVARAARARGAPGAAAEAWRRAIETAPDADQALRLRLERARDLAQAGRASEALVELDEILARGRAADLRADAEILQGQLLISQGRIEQAARSPGSGCGADPGPRSGARGGDALRGGVRQGEPRRGDSGRGDRRGGRRARRTAGRLVRGGGRVDARDGCSIAAGEGARGYPLLLRHAERGDPSARAPTAGPGRSPGPVRVLDGGLRHRASRARARGRPRARARSRQRPAARAERPRRARVPRRQLDQPPATHAEEALRLAEDADQFLHFGHIRVAAARRRDRRRRRRACLRRHRVDDRRSAAGAGRWSMYADAGRGLLELGLDHPRGRDRPPVTHARARATRRLRRAQLSCSGCPT